MGEKSSQKLFQRGCIRRVDGHMPDQVAESFDAEELALRSPWIQ